MDNTKVDIELYCKNSEKRLIEYEDVFIRFVLLAKKNKRLFHICNEHRVLQSYVISNNIGGVRSEHRPLEVTVTVTFLQPAIDCHISLCSLLDGYSFFELEEYILCNFRCMGNEEGRKTEWRDAVVNKLSVLQKLSWKDWSNLNRLCLDGRGLTQLPQALSHLRLKELDISNNKMSGLSKDWTFIDGILAQCLIKLSVANNGLVRIPDRIQRCYNLQSLDVHGNMMTTLPRAIFDPNKDLQKLDLRDCPNLLFLGHTLEPIRNLNVTATSPFLVCKGILEIIKTEPSSLVNLTFRSLWRNFHDDSRGIRQLHKWLFLTPGLMPESLREFLDAYSFCTLCDGREVVFTSRSFFTLVNKYSRNVELSSVPGYVLPEVRFVHYLCTICQSKRVCFHSIQHMYDD